MKGWWHRTRSKELESGATTCGNWSSSSMSSGPRYPPEETEAYAAELEYLPSAFEGAVREADTVADRRFDKAEEAGGLAELDRSMAEQKTFIAQQVAQEVALKDEGNQSDQVWLTLWADIPIKVLEPEGHAGVAGHAR